MSRRKFSRRRLLKDLASVGVCLPLASSASFPLVPALHAATDSPVAPRTRTDLSESEDAFLEDLERANFLYFWEQTNPQTGLVKDRCNVRALDTRVLGSIAATGFGLTALCIGEKRGYISSREARDRVLTTLNFLWKKLPNERGFFYHWANINTGERLLQSEISSVDTAILLCGVLTCGGHFRAFRKSSDLADEIFNRVDWHWLSEDTRDSPARMDARNRLSAIPLGQLQRNDDDLPVGTGSPSHPLPTETWDAWKRTKFEYDGIRYIGSFAPIFVHQYSQAWFDFRGKRDQLRGLLSELSARDRCPPAILRQPVETVSGLQ